MCELMWECDCVCAVCVSVIICLLPWILLSAGQWGEEITVNSQSEPSYVKWASS